MSTSSNNKACPTIPNDGCSICGPGKCVTNFDTIFAYPNQPAVECGLLEKAGHGGLVPLAECAFLPSLVKDKCKCRSNIPNTSEPTHKPTSRPTRNPTPSPTRAISSGSVCPNIPDGGCSICGPGKCVTDFDTIFAYPGQPAVECGVLEKAGHGGVIPLDQCGYLPQLVKNECKCRSSIPTTSKPTHRPTPSPTRNHTRSPTSSKPSSSKCPDIPDDGCSICGPGQCVTNFDNIFTYPGQPAVACGVLEKAGHGAVIPLDQCQILPQLVKNECNCHSSILAAPKPTHKPTPIPTRRQTPSPAPTKPSSSKCPDIPDDGCSICGPGKCVTDFETIFAYPGQPAVACGVMEKAGHGGVIPLDQCGYLPQLVKNDCKCRSSIPLMSRSSPSPTRKPATHKPTPSPTRKPTAIATITPEIEFPRVPFEPIGSPFNAEIYAGPKPDYPSSDGVTVGLSIGACLFGVVIIIYSTCLMRKGKNIGKDSIKDASTVSIELEADGSSLVMKDIFDEDLELL